ncbi:hypothetical protein Aple_084790 [Acrocarpospora pleiomorpha]|uniref:Lipoprotein n=1 Tax=Acrocarpospora pleiomorpha TaxID=90975 RepID=A0A5M3XX94_9ACTN|nr:hypothetical protein [Acrocarpospora pleiomorpha]GES25580.1 hypothetical protein Aple_084790 [Acrocarpospora pleiomorpha]
MMIVMYAAALAFAPIAAPMTGCDQSGCASTNNSRDTINTGNSKNSGNYRSANSVNSGNFSTANGSTTSGNSSLSSNNADGPQRIVIAKRIAKCAVKRRC